MFEIYGQGMVKYARHRPCVACVSEMLYRSLTHETKILSDGRDRWEGRSTERSLKGKGNTKGGDEIHDVSVNIMSISRTNNEHIDMIR